MAKQRRLLVVEDGGLAAKITPALTEVGWVVQACTSAREAICLARQQDVDGLVITATLPDERGDVVFYRLSSIHPHLRTHCIFLTRTDAEWNVVQTTHRVSLHLPVTPDQVVRTVNEFYVTPTAS